ncbi:MAG: hypothetical protein IKC43_01415 [Clostridia bacterium]|nr:hypothetical protein [Clostridia bacterium]
MHSEPPLSDGTVGRSRRTAWCALLILSVLCSVFEPERRKGHAVGRDAKKEQKEKYALSSALLRRGCMPVRVRC